jgi:phytanoyl-CoA hydroxylase
MTVEACKRRYEEDGYLKIERLFSEQQMSELESELDRYFETVVPRLPPTDIVYERAPGEGGRRAIRNLWRMEQHIPYFAALARSAESTELAGSLVNGDPVLMAVELFAKPPKVGSAVPYHQDNGYFNLAPPDAFTCWLALDDSTEENGCVYYARGTHREGLRPHQASFVPGNSWGLAELPDPHTLDEAPGVLSRGDAMLHHCCLLHRSEANRSERPRRGLLFVFKGAHCRVDEAGMARYTAAAKALQSFT